MAVRILHVATRHRVGGAERNLLYTVSRELDRGFEVHVAAGTEGLRDEFPASVQLHRLPDVVRDMSPGADRRAVRELQALIRRHGFDVVHTHQSKAGALGRIAARRLVPVLVHTVHMASFGPAYGPGRTRLFLAVERRLASVTDRFIFVGTDLRRRYLAARAAYADRSIVIRSPITNLGALLELRQSRDRRRAAARLQLGVPADRQMVLMVGALDRRKRHALAIEALAPLLTTGKAHLVIAGEGPERRALEQLTARLRVADSVRFVGFAVDVRALYAAADVFLHASALEGVAQAIVQALAAGVPVVATDVDGVREAAPDMPHVTVLPLNGRGLAEAVNSRLAGPAPPPVPEEKLKQWLPASVDAQLSAFHEWLDAEVLHRRARAADLPRAWPARPAMLPARKQVVR